jgi:hypothetical protein
MIEEALLVEASQRRCGDPDRVLHELESPDWEFCDSICNDWEFCVPESVSDRWGELSLEAKLVAYLIGSRGVELIPEPPDV